VHAARMRQWREDNPEAARAADKRRTEATKADPDRLARKREYQRRYNAKANKQHPDRRKAVMRKAELLKKYGMTPEQYDATLEEQGGVCAICKTAPVARRLSVDHDHETLVVRGLLCSPCNSVLGFANDDIDRLKAAIAYLERWRNA
jgi:ABC-type nitrate/sulfonate/bicarbonate transport system substrate-binding protein